jgi:hypothetical protein
MVLGTVPARHWFCGALIREKHGQGGTFAAGEYEKGRSFLRSSEQPLEWSIFRRGRGEMGIESLAVLRKARTMDQEKRRAPRYPFIASAEVRTEITGTQLAARISDISSTGCYVDTINPLAGGTSVRLKIHTETQVFEASATVVYAHTHLGMGLKFGELPANSQTVLQAWPPTPV